MLHPRGSSSEINTKGIASGQSEGADGISRMMDDLARTHLKIKIRVPDKA
jgi:hypothetical protein